MTGRQARQIVKEYLRLCSENGHSNEEIDCLRTELEKKTGSFERLRSKLKELQILFMSLKPNKKTLLLFIKYATNVKIYGTALFLVGLLMLLFKKKTLK